MLKLWVTNQIMEPREWNYVIFRMQTKNEMTPHEYTELNQIQRECARWENQFFSTYTTTKNKIDT